MSSPISNIRPARATHVRWLMFAFLFAFAFAAYVQRTAVSVAAVPMMPQLGLSQLQIGWLETAFLVGYTALQFPGGVLGQFLGARKMFTMCGLLAVAATLAIPILPALALSTLLFWALMLAQFLLGAAQSPVFALTSAVLERWFPPHQWALTQGTATCGVGLGSAAAPAVIASLMVVVGWRPALLIVALPVLLLIAAWWWQGRDTPADHPAVNAMELAELRYASAAVAPPPPDWKRLHSLLLNRDLIGLTVSYLSMNFVFYLITLWSFLYLVQARHFTVLGGGLSAAVPSLGGAAGAAVGGFAGSALTRRLGARRGLRLLPLITLPASGALLLVSVHAASAITALAGLTLAFGLLEVNEACFWAASMEIGQEDSAAAGGILNTGGNIGGIIATPLVGWMSGNGNWTTPFIAGAGFAALSAAIWLLIDPAPQDLGALRPSPQSPDAPNPNLKAAV